MLCSGSHLILGVRAYCSPLKAGDSKALLPHLAILHSNFLECVSFKPQLVSYFDATLSQERVTRHEKTK
jgi:hypothetical protein